MVKNIMYVQKMLKHIYSRISISSWDGKDVEVEADIFIDSIDARVRRQARITSVADNVDGYQDGVWAWDHTIVCSQDTHLFVGEKTIMTQL